MEADGAEHGGAVGVVGSDLRHPEQASLAGLVPVLDELVALFARDKKAVRGVTFVLDGPDGVEPVTGVDERAVRDALEAVMA